MDDGACGGGGELRAVVKGLGLQRESGQRLANRGSSRNRPSSLRVRQKEIELLIEKSGEKHLVATVLRGFRETILMGRTSRR